MYFYRMEEIHYKAMSCILDELFANYPSYVDIRKVMLERKMIHRDKSDNLFNFKCNEIGKIICSRQIAEGNRNYPNYKFIQLRINENGIKMIDEYKSFYKKHQLSRERIKWELFRLNYWWLIGITSFLAGFATSNFTQLCDLIQTLICKI